MLKPQTLWRVLCNIYNKSVFSFIRQLSARHCPHLLLCAVLRRRCCRVPAPVLRSNQSISPTHRALSSKPAAAVDRRGGRTLDRIVLCGQCQVLRLKKVCNRRTIFKSADCKSSEMTGFDRHRFLLVVCSYSWNGSGTVSGAELLRLGAPADERCFVRSATA